MNGLRFESLDIYSKSINIIINIHLYDYNQLTYTFVYRIMEQKQQSKSIVNPETGEVKLKSISHDAYIVTNDDLTAIDKYVRAQAQTKAKGRPDITYPWINTCKCLILQGDVKVIPYGAFRGFVNLHSVYIPSTVSKIGQCVFKDLTNLEVVRIQDNEQFLNPSFNPVKPRSQWVQSMNAATSVDNNNFVATHTSRSTLTKIGTQAFCGCSGLKTVYLPRSLREIEENAFMNCVTLQNIMFDATNWDFNMNHNPRKMKRGQEIGYTHVATLYQCLTEERLPIFTNCPGIESIVVSNYNQKQPLVLYDKPCTLIDETYKFDADQSTLDSFSDEFQKLYYHMESLQVHVPENFPPTKTKRWVMENTPIITYGFSLEHEREEYIKKYKDAVSLAFTFNAAIMYTQFKRYNPSRDYVYDNDINTVVAAIKLFNAAQANMDFADKLGHFKPVVPSPDRVWSDSSDSVDESLPSKRGRQDAESSSTDHNTSNSSINTIREYGSPTDPPYYPSSDSQITTAFGHIVDSPSHNSSSDDDEDQSQVHDDIDELAGQLAWLNDDLSSERDGTSSSHNSSSEYHADHSQVSDDIDELTTILKQVSREPKPEPRESKPEPREPIVVLSGTSSDDDEDPSQLSLSGDNMSESNRSSHTPEDHGGFLDSQSDNNTFESNGSSEETYDDDKPRHSSTPIKTDTPESDELRPRSRYTGTYKEADSSDCDDDDNPQDSASKDTSLIDDTNQSKDDSLDGSYDPTSPPYDSTVNS